MHTSSLLFGGHPTSANHLRGIALDGLIRVISSPKRKGGDARSSRWLRAPARAVGTPAPLTFPQTYYFILNTLLLAGCFDPRDTAARRQVPCRVLVATRGGEALETRAAQMLPAKQLKRRDPLQQVYLHSQLALTTSVRGGFHHLIRAGRRLLLGLLRPPLQRRFSLCSSTHHGRLLRAEGRLVSAEQRAGVPRCICPVRR